MAAEFERDELRNLVIDSYELMLKIPPPANKGGKYEIGSRGKLKNLPEALREFEDAQAAVTHFIKSAAYFLPRSDSELSDFLDMLFEKVHKIQGTENDPEKIREKIRYLIGYSNWGMDAVCYIFEKSENEVEIKERLQKMIGAEMKAVESEEKTGDLVNKIMEWKENGKGRRK